MKEVPMERIVELSGKMLSGISRNVADDAPLDVVMAALYVAATLAISYDLEKEEGITEQKFLSNTERIYQSRKTYLKQFAFAKVVKKESRS